MIGQRGLPATHGGVERHVEELGTRLAARGHEVVAFCRRNYVSSSLDELEGVRLEYLPTVSSKHLEAALHSGLAALRTVGRQFDIVHFHAVGPGLWSPIPRYLSGAAVVQTIHGLDQDRAKWGGLASRVLKGGDWLSKRVPDGVIVVGEYLLDHYGDRVGVTDYIPNGVTITEPGDESMLGRFGLEPDGYVLFVGRLIPEKAIDHLIRAFQVLDVDKKLVVAGGTSFTDRYVDELRDLAGRDERVSLVGYVYGAELGALYSNACLYVQPSLLEGLPLAVLEAIAHGVPAVLSDIPPHREVIPQSRPGGRLYPAGDVTALAEAIEKGVSNSAEERAAAEDAAVDVIRRYSWDSAADATEALYARLLSAKRREAA